LSEDNAYSSPRKRIRYEETFLGFFLGETAMKNLILAYLNDEDGQTSTEYILLVAVVAMIVFKFREIAERRLTAIIEQVFGKASDLVNQM